MPSRNHDLDCLYFTSCKCFKGRYKFASSAAVGKIVMQVDFFTFDKATGFREEKT